MGREEQVEEREVLSSIFPDEIIDVSETAYRISIDLDVPNPQNKSQDEADKHAMILHVAYPPSYPDVGPDLDLTNEPDAPRHPLLDVVEDKARLLEALEPTIEENLGMAMIFTLVTTLKDAAETLIIERQNQVQEARELESRKAEEEENRRFHGTPVTKDSFLEWRSKFRMEMAEKDRIAKEETEAEEKKRGVRPKVEERKLTGRQLWERGLASKADEVEVEVDGEDALAGIEKLKVEG